MKKIITHGHCSARYKWPTWPDFINHYLDDAEIINLGKPGVGNETIARDVVNSCMKHKGIDHIYIMWGAPHRHDVFTEGNHNVTNDKDSWSMFDPDYNWTITYNGHYNSQANDTFDRYKTLENILYTQMFLDKQSIEYTMMIYDTRTLPIEVQQSKSEHALKQKIDWNKFLFYKKSLGLRDFAEYLYPDQFPDEESNKGDRHLHPLPYAHYKWVKDIMFQSQHEISLQLDNKYKLWKSSDIADRHWMSEAKRIIPWEVKDA